MDKSAPSVIFSRGIPISRKTSEKTDAIKAILFATVLAVFLLMVLVSIVQAQGGAQAFGYYRPSSQPRSVGAYIWTGNPPDGLGWTGTPLGIIKGPWQATDKFIESGWVKGTAWGLNNTIRQYVTYRDTNGTFKMDILWVRTLVQNTWYRFRVVYYKSHQKWEVKLTGHGINQWVWRQPHPLGWDRGDCVAGGSEANLDGGWMDAYAWHPEYRTWNGSWTLWNYSDNNPPPYTSPHGHITHAYDFGWRAWGP